MAKCALNKFVHIHHAVHGFR